MADYVTLMGAEDVRRAGSSMQDAAATMSRAASQIDESLRQHQRFMEDWLARLQAVLENHTNGVTTT